MDSRSRAREKPRRFGHGARLSRRSPRMDSRSRARELPGRSRSRRRARLGVASWGAGCEAQCGARWAP